MFRCGFEGNMELQVPDETSGVGARGSDISVPLPWVPTPPPR